MDDGFNLFIFCRVSQRLTSQHFGISGNMVNVRYYFLIFFCCLLQAEAATLWVMRSHYTMITEVWFQALFPALSCQTYPSILWKEIWMVNIYPLSYFGEHYPHLCDACFSSELKVYSVFLTSPAQQICLQSILISVPDCRRRLCVCGWTCVCVFISSHLWYRTTTADVSLSWWCPPCEWQAPFRGWQRWSGARRTWLAQQRVVGGWSTRCRASTWTSVRGCPGLWLWSGN